MEEYVRYVQTMIVVCLDPTEWLYICFEVDSIYIYALVGTHFKNILAIPHYFEWTKIALLSFDLWYEREIVIEFINAITWEDV